jgi:hypothetical protein
MDRAADRVRGVVTLVRGVVTLVRAWLVKEVTAP